MSSSKNILDWLRLLGTVGEPINPEAWIWYQQMIGKGRCPIVDTWWQTETGAIMIAPVPGAIRESLAQPRGHSLELCLRLLQKKASLYRRKRRPAGHPQTVAIDGAHHLQRS